MIVRIRSYLVVSYVLLLALRCRQDVGTEIPILDQEPQDQEPRKSGETLATLGSEAFERTRGQSLHFRNIVMRFEFSPDGNETWCVAGWSGVRRGDDRGRAVIFENKNGTWENLPSPDDAAVFHDVAFSKDGKTTWIAMSSDDDRQMRVRQRPTNSKQWNAFSTNMPNDYNIVERFWLTPNGRELWMYTSDCGLTRVKRGSDTVSQYVQSDFRQFDNIQHHTLVEDYVTDLVFTSDSQTAVCAARGGGIYGITKIKLSDGKSTNFPVTDAIDFERLVMSPDDETVWCIGSNDFLWAFDIETETWTHKCSSDDEMPLSMIDRMACSRDGKFVWIAGHEGVACYSTQEKTWKGYTGDDWYMQYDMSEVSRSPLFISSDSKWVLTGHNKGLALHDVSGRTFSIIETGVTSRCCCSHIVPVPNADTFICAIEHDRGGGLYLFDSNDKSLRKQFLLKQPVTSMTFSPQSRLWAAIPGTVYELSVDTNTVVRQHGFATKPAARDALENRNR